MNANAESTAAPLCEQTALNRVVRWLPAVAWMTCIFSASTGAMSAAHTSLYFEPLMRWLFPGISQQSIGFWHFMVRKAAHVSEYAVLAVLLRHAIRQAFPDPRNRDYWKTAGVALVLAALYAATDEFHQSFVPSREGSVVDVLIDTVGAACGLAVLAGFDTIRLWLRSRRRELPEAGKRV